MVSEEEKVDKEIEKVEREMSEQLSRPVKVVVRNLTHVTIGSKVHGVRTIVLQRKEDWERDQLRRKQKQTKKNSMMIT